MPPTADGEPDLCVALVPLFQDLDRAEQLQVAELARPIGVDRGEPLTNPGGRDSQLLVVHTGRIKIVRTTPDGHEHLVRVLGPGEFVGETAFVTGQIPAHDVVALEPSSLCRFRHRDLGALLRGHPSVALRMLSTVSQRLQQVEGRLAAVISGDVNARLASYLLSLAAHPVEGGIAVDLPLAKKDIAALLDTTPESLSRQLRRLRDSGIATALGERRLLLHDVEALTALAATT